MTTHIVGNNVDGLETLFDTLRQIQAAFDEGERPSFFASPFGTHGVLYGDSDGEDFALVGFCLPDGVYAEIEDGTYGQQQGWRFFL